LPLCFTRRTVPGKERIARIGMSLAKISQNLSADDMHEVNCETIAMFSE
jgi:hypothetical protein